MSIIFTLIAIVGLIGLFYPTGLHKKIKLDTRLKNCVLLLTAIVVGALASEDTSIADPAKASGQAETKKKVTTIYKTGEAVKVGYLEYKINKVSDKAKVKDSMGTIYKAGDGARYVLINISVKNNDKDQITMTDDLLKLIEKDGTEYSADTQNGVWANETGQTFFFELINPKMSKTSNIIFAVPNDVKLGDLILEVQGGMLSGDKAKISLK